MINAFFLRIWYSLQQFHSRVPVVEQTVTWTMSEFVEEGIEGLLPVFETVVGVQLLSSSEVDAFVKRCKAYEYRLQRAVSNLF